MATQTNRPRQRSTPISLALQDLHIRHRFPDFSAKRDRRAYTWHGDLQPTLFSATYRVAVRYRLGELPSVRVLSPALAPNAPHLYRGGTLCLYWPEEWRWRGDALIADTILPWTASWLFHYELWIDTGEWLGPSSHYAPTPKAEDDRAA
jgi:hypothetical protein